MNKDEAAAAMEAVSQSERKLAEAAQWPLWRHGAFGLAEAGVIFGLTLPPLGLAACVLLSFSTIIWIFHDDRQRYGMFVSGWHGTKPRIAVIAMIIFVATMAGISISARGEPSAITIGLITASATFLVCTLGSMWWQSLYRKELRQGVGR